MAPGNGHANAETTFGHSFFRVSLMHVRVFWCDPSAGHRGKGIKLSNPFFHFSSSFLATRPVVFVRREAKMDKSK